MILVDVKEAVMQHTAADRVTEFAGSDLFRRLFAEGMALVEETAAYLDGPGRDDAKRLGRSGALAYAAESMALTTRLMQCASWLLTQRAVSEGELAPADAGEEQYRLGGTRAPGKAAWPEGDEPCPPRLFDLITRAAALHERLKRLDQELFSGKRIAPTGENPLAAQWSALETAFGTRD
ncbi:DUF1465 family protein [Glycocaulis profundi]|nr:DUF1465 family protein [Glycocaulis profundi]